MNNDIQGMPIPPEEQRANALGQRLSIQEKHLTELYRLFNEYVVKQTELSGTLLALINDQSVAIDLLVDDYSTLTEKVERLERTRLKVIDNGANANE